MARILIIEDNPKHAKALAYFLESYNINSEIKSEIPVAPPSIKLLGNKKLSNPNEAEAIPNDIRITSFPSLIIYFFVYFPVITP